MGEEYEMTVNDIVKNLKQVLSEVSFGKRSDPY